MLAACGEMFALAAVPGFGVEENVVDELLERFRGGNAKGEHGGCHVAPRDDRFLDRCVCPQPRTAAIAIAGENPFVS